jgi:hypothetical protein
MACLLLENLKKIYRLRDLAVHPSGKVQEALLHPELGVGVEWRFVYFRADISEGAVNAATAIVWDLAFQGKPVSDHVRGIGRMTWQEVAGIIRHGAGGRSLTDFERFAASRAEQWLDSLGSHPSD